MAEKESTKERVTTLLTKSKDIFFYGVRQGRMRMNLYQMERQRKDFLLRLGEVAYPIIKDGKIDIPELTGISMKINSLETEIEKERERLKKSERPGDEESIEDSEVSVGAEESPEVKEDQGP